MILNKLGILSRVARRASRIALLLLLLLLCSLLLLLCLCRLCSTHICSLHLFSSMSCYMMASASHPHHY
jgi:hypothetical protein